MAKREISTGEAAKILGISFARIHQLAASGKIEGTYHKKNNGKRGRWTLSRKSVMERLEAQQAAEASIKAGEHKPIAPSGYMTTRQVAEHFGVATETVRSWVRRGQLQTAGTMPQRFGRDATVFANEVVDAFVPPSVSNPNWRAAFIPNKGIVKDGKTYSLDDVEQGNVEQGNGEQADIVAEQQSEIERLEAQITELREQMTATNQSNMDLLSSKIDQIVEVITQPS